MGLVPTLNSRRLSDTELLRTEFRVRDPESIEGLNRDVPDSTAHPIIVGFYDETPPGGRAANPNAPFIRCCHCGTRRHWKGHVVRDDRDEIYIIGARVCGREHYGARYEAAEKAFREERARQDALLRWQSMVPLVPAVTAEVEALLHCADLTALELKRDAIQRAAPEAFRRLTQAAASGDSLTEIREERDYAAETQRHARYERALAAYRAKDPQERRWLRDEGRRPEPDTGPIYVRTSTPLGPLAGAGFLTDAADLRRAALALRETLNAVQAVEARGTEQAWLTELKRLLREMTDRPRSVTTALQSTATAHLFFAPDNLDRLERWTSSNPRCSFHRDERSLVIDDSAKGRTKIAPLPPLSLPATPFLLSADRGVGPSVPMLAQVA